MDLGGGVPLSEDNSVRGLPGLDFQTGLVPTTPVKPVSARQQTAEGDKGLHWLSALGISSTGELPVEIAHPTDSSYAGTAGISHTDQACHLNVPAVYATYRQRQAYQDTAARLGQNFHGDNVACGLTGFCSVSTPVNSPLMQPSLPTSSYPGNNGGSYHQRHQFSVSGSRTALLIQISAAKLAYHILASVRYD